MKLSRRIFSLILVLVLLGGTMALPASARGDIMYGIGFTTGSDLLLRSQPSTSASVLDISPKGEVVVVIEKTGDWYKVNYNLQVGYMHSDYVSVLTKENAELGYGKINGSAVNLRSGPSTSQRILATSRKNDRVYIIGLNTGWYKVLYGSRICYIRSDYVDLTEVPYENDDSSKSPIFFRNGKSTGVPVSAAALNGGTGNSGNTGSNNNSGSNNIGSASGNAIVDCTKQYLGVPYVWGGASPSGFDCSGLVYYVLNKVGISVPRSLAQQQSMGTPVSKENLQPGDIVYFANTYASGISHVGIYAGNGKFIHAPHSGAVVSYADLNSAYYTQHYYSARRFSK